MYFLLHGIIASFPNIYLFSNLSVSVWTCIYFVFCIIIQYYIVSVSQTVPALPFETSFNRLLFPFDIFPLLCACSSFPSFLFLLLSLSLSFLLSYLLLFSFSSFLFSSTTRYSKFTLYIPCPQPRLSHFHKGSRFLLFSFIGKGFRNQHMYIKCAFQMSFL